MTLLYVGITLIGNTIWPLVLLPFVLAVVQRGVIEREERYLERKFGDEYLRYKSRVRRWI
jgi:protein-S-isoprenylcysteine O-methyltransferase Ste14